MGRERMKGRGGKGREGKGKEGRGKRKERNEEFTPQCSLAVDATDASVNSEYHNNAVIQFLRRF